MLPMYDGEVHFFNDRGETAETANPNRAPRLAPRSDRSLPALLQTTPVDGWRRPTRTKPRPELNPDPNPRTNIAGQALDKRSAVPRLRVRKDWHVVWRPTTWTTAVPTSEPTSTENFESGFREPDPVTRGAPEHAHHALRRQEARSGANGGKGGRAEDFCRNRSRPRSEGRRSPRRRRRASRCSTTTTATTRTTRARSASAVWSTEDVKTGDYRAFPGGHRRRRGTQGVGGSVNEGDEGRGRF